MSVHPSQAPPAVSDSHLLAIGLADLPLVLGVVLERLGSHLPFGTLAIAVSKLTSDHTSVSKGGCLRRLVYEDSMRGVHKKYVRVAQNSLEINTKVPPAGTICRQAVAHRYSRAASHHLARRSGSSTFSPGLRQEREQRPEL